MNLNFSNNNPNYDFEPDDNLDPNEIVEDLYKNFTYEELYNMSITYFTLYIANIVLLVMVWTYYKVLHM